VAWAELEGEVLGKVDGGGFGGGVAECSLWSKSADTDTSDGAGDDDAGGVVEFGVDLEEGSESARGFLLDNASILKWVRNVRTSEQCRRYSSHSNP
jgi:hypothetical protein